MYGLEAGQSAVGDIFNWFVKQLTPGEYGNEATAHQRLSAEAAKLRPGQSGLVALDWNNGNRTILVDPLLTGLLVGQTLHTTAAEVYRALVESTAFGALAIINRLGEYGVKVDEVINCGGIAEKNDFVMQILGTNVCPRRGHFRRGRRGRPRQRRRGPGKNDRR
jgi:L-ribulokinase